MSIIDQVLGLGLRDHRKKLAHARYDFAVSGGAIGSIALLGQLGIPLGATIVTGWVEVTTALTSGGSATAALQVEGAGDIVPAQTLGTWTVGRKRIIPSDQTSTVLAATTDVRTTAPRDITLVIATAVLTAGKFDVILEYIDPLA